MKKLVLFDLDGTLITSGMCGKEGLDTALENITGKKPQYSLQLITGNTDSKNFGMIFELVKGRKIKPAEFKKLKEEYLKVLPQMVKKNQKIKKIKNIKGIEKFLTLLSKQKDICLGLGTGNFEKAAYIKLEPSGLGKYFKTGGFGDNCIDRAKMLAEGVKNAEKFFKNKFTPENVYIVGDTYKDIVAAKENGYHSAVVITDPSSPELKKLYRAAAELEEKDFTDLNTWSVWLDIKSDPKGVKRGNYIMPASAIEHVFFSRTGIDEDRLKMFRIKKYEKLPSGKLF
ncbi:putative phosphatase [Elusimicrobium minutum Pei191]|uniref:phosphoglycolate phosphatase n=1 Tax=Elusimicrobium minutum (strain Pei191) TaxID=445932 RepID=B2KBG6_ELUMP|nr:HAD hydrolase-like protein [Elusimicrobium minutum]ACC97988.1 putative phosphatase [Elusimicrobium minutum Pei191]